MSGTPNSKKTTDSNEVFRRLESRIDDLCRYLEASRRFTQLTTPSKLHEKILAIRSVCITAKDPNLNWLFLAALGGAFPALDVFREFDGQLQNATETDSLHSLLLCATPALMESQLPPSHLEIVENCVIVDVNFCARTDFTTGVQRVTRNLVSEWAIKKDFLLVAWDSDGAALTRLTATESQRMLGKNKPAGATTRDGVMLLPIDSTYFLPEITEQKQSGCLACMAYATSNKFVAIVYDFIPVTSAPKLSDHETQKFVMYLSAIKHFDVVIPISGSTATEFQGYNLMLRAQGLQGPQVHTVQLPITRIPAQHDSKPRLPASGLPLVLSVGTIEPRKNQRKILAAAEILWQRGYEFELEFVGNANPTLSGEFLRELDELQKRGRLVNIRHGLSDEELSALYDCASFSVFISEHEGYGLPIAESLSHNLPIVATDFGIMSELATLGTAILVNPRNLDNVVAGIESMLLQRDQEHETKIEGFYGSSWNLYAEAVWNHLVR